MGIAHPIYLNNANLKMSDFRELPEWEKAHKLTVAIYEITKSFPEAEL